MSTSQPRPVLTPPTNAVARPPLTRPEYIEEGTGAAFADVTEFGAQGNGVADDTAAIAAAIASLGLSGGTVFFPSGTYLITTLNLDSTNNIRLVGLGGNTPGSLSASTITSATAGAGSIISARSSVGLEIANLRIIYTNAAFTGVVIDYSHVTASDSAYMRIDKCFVGGSGVRSAHAIILLNQCIIGSFVDCIFANAERAVEGRNNAAFYSNAMTFRGCTFVGLVITAVTNAGQAWTFYGCTFENLVTAGGAAAGAGAYNFDVGYSAAALTFDGCWMGDASAAGTWIRFAGSNLTVRGSSIYRGVLGGTAIDVPGGLGSQGVTIMGNQMFPHTTAINLGANILRAVIYANDYQNLCTNEITCPDAPGCQFFERIPGAAGFERNYFSGHIYLKSAHQTFTEIADPGSGGADAFRFYARDNGAGKTQACVVFNTGAVQVLATEP